MKKLHFITLAAAAALTAACSSTETVYEYVRLSDAACTFLASDNTQKSIEVTASGAWQADAGASWLTVERQDDYLLLAAADNDSGMERVTEIVITSGSATAGIKVIQMAPESSMYRYRILKTFDMGAKMSKNGRYVGGNIKELLPDETWENYPTIIDLETDEWIQLGPFPNSLFNLELPFAISDEGTIFFLDANTSACVGFNLAGDYFLPANAKDFNLLPSVQSISADGRIWVGFGMDDVLAFGGMYRPLKWTDGGTPEVLPVPELNFRNEPYVAGVMARGCSADGSVIYGGTWDNLDNGMLYWKDGQVDWVGSDVREVRTVQVENGVGEMIDYNIVNGMTVTAELTNISPNGKWIAGTYRTEDFPTPRSYVQEQYPAFFNTETKTTTIVTDFGQGFGAHATDDGLGIILIGTFLPSSGIVYDIENQVSLGSVQEWVLDNYHMVIPMCYINYMTSDKSSMIGTVVEESALGPRTVSWYMAPPVER